MSDIVDSTGLPSSTVARLVDNLLGVGVLDRTDRVLRVGSRVFIWAEAARRGRDVVELLMPVLKQLRDGTNETAAVYERRGLERVCTALVKSRQSVVWDLYVGLTTDLYVGSGGRVFLAYDQDLTEAVLSRSRKKYTEKTVIDSDLLLKSLENIRRDMVAVSIEELANGVAGVSCPVFDARGCVVAAIGVGGPVQRFTEQRIDFFREKVTWAAIKASELMGGTFPGTLCKTHPT